MNENCTTPSPPIEARAEQGVRSKKRMKSLTRIYVVSLLLSCSTKIVFTDTRTSMRQRRFSTLFHVVVVVTFVQMTQFYPLHYACRMDERVVRSQSSKSSIFPRTVIFTRRRQRLAHVFVENFSSVFVGFYTFTPNSIVLITLSEWERGRKQRHVRWFTYVFADCLPCKVD